MLRELAGSWTCHACGQRRRDADIAVYTIVVRLRRRLVIVDGVGGQLEHRVSYRYCRGVDACRERARGLAETGVRALWPAGAVLTSYKTEDR